LTSMGCCEVCAGVWREAQRAVASRRRVKSRRMFDGSLYNFFRETAF
jgi:hypothetical protein